MKRTLGSLAGCAIALSLSGMPRPEMASAAPTTYYVSQSCGNDRSDGEAATWDGKHGPWKTLARASAVTYRPGGQLLLKCGDTWNETLTLRGDGAAGNPVTVASYGPGERPFLRRSKGNRTACVILDKASGQRIRDLEMGFAQNALRIAADSRVKTAIGYVNTLGVELRDQAGEGPAAWWKLDETSGTTAADSVGGSTGLLSGCKWSDGKINGGLEFGGVKDSVAISPAKLKTISDTFTISFWAYPRAARTSTKETGSGASGISGQEITFQGGHGTSPSSR